MAIEDAAILSRCLEGVEREGIASAFQRFEATRKERTTRVQLTSRANTWLKGQTETEWVYAYNAYTAPLAPTSNDAVRTRHLDKPFPNQNRTF